MSNRDALNQDYGQVTSVAAVQNAVQETDSTAVSLLRLNEHLLAAERELAEGRLS